MADGTITWREIWDETAVQIGRPQARWVCEVAAGLDGDELLAALDDGVSARSMAHLDAMLGRLALGEPLQYVLGRWGFRRLDLMVDRRVLIPRPETETVVEIALDLARSRPRPIVCADLGTGSGAIGLALATELGLDGVTVWMTDRSIDALDVARANAAGVGRASVNVRLSHGDWFNALPAELGGHLDLVVANPPYVADDDELEPAVREWEPASALMGGPDGLDHVRAIVAAAPRWLRPGGSLVLEIGWRQGEAVSMMLDAAGLVDVRIEQDLSGRDRIAVARRAGP